MAWNVQQEHVFAGGSIPGAHSISMEKVGKLGIVDALGKQVISELLRLRRHCLIIVVSSVVH